MLRVPIALARPGMELALPVYHPKRQESALLRAGVVLESHVIERLRELHLREIWITYPNLDFLAEHVSPTLIQAGHEVTTAVAPVFEAAREHKHARLEYPAYRRAVQALLERLLESPRARLFMHELGSAGPPPIRHAGNVCLLALLMGIKLESYLMRERSRIDAVLARDVSSLGLAGLLHDIGMLRLDDDTLDRWNRTQDESDPAWQEHVHVGFRMVQGEIEPSAAAAVLHHHQRFDGTGFPDRATFDGRETRVAGHDIHVFARILAAADLFDRTRNPMHAPRAELNPAPTIPMVRALNLMLAPPRSRWIDPVVRQALIAVVPPYAPGTLVTLNDGTRCVVAEWTHLDPCRPVVQTIGDPTTHFDDDEPGERINLRDRPDLYVAVAEGQDVAADNFFPGHATEFDLDLALRRQYNAA